MINVEVYLFSFKEEPQLIEIAASQKPGTPKYESTGHL